MGIMSLWNRDHDPLLSFHEVIEAVGREHDMGETAEEVPLGAVVGSVGRSDDFDRDFRPLRRSARLAEVRRRFDAGEWPPPIRLLRLGELYFVVDGHHRVAVARERGWTTLPASVRRICTTAYARACLRACDLTTSAAERRFLEVLPLPDDVRTENSLGSPADWTRIADAAMAWGYRRLLVDGTSYCCAADLAAAWWHEEVTPVVAAWRAGPAGDHGLALTDLEVFVTELARRDDLGQLDWQDPANREAPCH
ncbi:ParB-like nuclease domain-containing protein [Phycicoccus sp. CSK15P-2]|uniref:ParB N-terminal domain-containing protein n=1 Tax=Phycicoccus sp. CSK15P-2 TaxID=2807627 RepID=UPI00194F880F|nr:ParB N-terminal domain-containing protein [Phycicoccus sp. CSK15P-2]MBM6405444.1 ParB-like nuclease domain-containing protein [Phycicoccus sp. CSK15P-2]